MDIVILAAGLGKRMGGDLPKALTPVAGKPMVRHLVDAITKANIADSSPIIVIGHKGELLRAELGENFRYAVQKEQRGTGHAVKYAKPHVRENNAVMILYGDHPNVQPKTLATIAEHHKRSGAILTMATVSLKDFLDWRASFLRFGRILRNSNGAVERIVEFKDATDTERGGTEVNPSYFCANSAWLFHALEKITAHNVQKEYYLTDIVGIAVSEGKHIETVSIPPEDALGANTPEELAVLERIMRER